MFACVAQISRSSKIQNVKINTCIIAFVFAESSACGGGAVSWLLSEQQDKIILSHFHKT